MYLGSQIFTPPSYSVPTGSNQSPIFSLIGAPPAVLGNRALTTLSQAHAQHLVSSPATSRTMSHQLAHNRHRPNASPIVCAQVRSLTSLVEAIVPAGSGTGAITKLLQYPSWTGDPFVSSARYLGSLLSLQLQPRPAPAGDLPQKKPLVIDNIAWQELTLLTYHFPSRLHSTLC
ncbi:hypothetical protein PMIN06_006947 [Paraphaeosphaeria minitans]